MIGGFGQRGGGVERKVGELLHLLSLSARAEDEKTSDEADAEQDQDDQGYQEFHHGRSQASGRTARVVSDDETGANDGHC